MYLFNLKVLKNEIFTENVQNWTSTGHKNLKSLHDCINSERDMGYF